MPIALLIYNHLPVSAIRQGRPTLVVWTSMAPPTSSACAGVLGRFVRYCGCVVRRTGSVSRRSLPIRPAWTCGTVCRVHVPVCVHVKMAAVMASRQVVRHPTSQYTTHRERAIGPCHLPNLPLLQSPFWSRRKFTLPTHSDTPSATRTVVSSCLRCRDRGFPQAYFSGHPER